MCFAPQRRALFRHLNCQKWSRAGVFCTFWLGNVLRATTACTFSSLIWPAGSAPAALASLLFDPPEPQIIGKIQCFATFLPFRATASYFFSLFLFSDLLSSIFLFSLTLPISAFHLSILSKCMMLNFDESNLWFFSRNHTSQFLCQGNCSTDAESNDAANLPQQNLPKPKTPLPGTSAEKPCKRNNWCYNVQNKMMFNDFLGGGGPAMHMRTPTDATHVKRSRSLLKAWSPSCRPVARIWRVFEMHGET